MAVVVAVLEFFGGIAILLGFLARPVDLLVMIDLTALAVLFAGSGKFSLEQKLFKKELF